MILTQLPYFCTILDDVMSLPSDYSKFTHLPGPLVLLHKVLLDIGLLHRQVIYQLDLVLVVELELLVVPPPYLTLLLDLSLDLQGGLQEACSLTPEDNLALFPVQGSIFPMTYWL